MIGLFGGVGLAVSNRAGRNDPEGVRPRRGAEAWRESAEAGSDERQRVAGADPDHTGSNCEVGRGAQRPNGPFGDSVERQRGRPGALILPR